MIAKVAKNVSAVNKIIFPLKIFKLLPKLFKLFKQVVINI